MHIIVVDDEKIALDGLVLAMKQSQPNATVHAFTGARAALDYVKENPCDIAFLDIQMRGMDGIELAKLLKLANHSINIIFTTGYAQYKGDAMDLRASGYLMKPITAEKITTEIENLRHPIKVKAECKVSVRTFGNFEVYIDDAPVKFHYQKTKEMFAYLVSRRGALCTNNEIMAILWEDEAKASYFRNIRSDMLQVFPNHIFVKQWGKIGIIPHQIACDYYDWQDGKLSAINAYTGEYMSQYSWGEFTLSRINARQE